MMGYFNPFEGASIAYGSDITIQMNQSADDYVITINLINDQGTVISTSSIDLPIETLVKSGRYDTETKTIILILENDEEIDIPISDLISGLQEEITSQNKLSSDLVDDTNAINLFMTSSEKTKLSNCKTTWQGTRAQYEALVSDDYDRYEIEEVVSS